MLFALCYLFGGKALRLRFVTHSLLRGLIFSSQIVRRVVREIEVKKSFGASVRSWRKRQGISQEELAERATLHRTYISDVERGARNVSLQSIERIARALAISLPELFSYDSASSGPGNGMPPQESKE